MKKVIAIVGPTASGKTNLAINIKEKYPEITIINGDSVQVYKNLNIGSDKISYDIQKKYPHHLLDFVPLDKNYTVYNFQKDARKIINDNQISLIVGGSGFYIKSVLYDYRFRKNIYDKKEYERIIKKGDDYIKEYILSKDPNISLDFSNERKKLQALRRILNYEIPSENIYENNKVYNSLIIYLDLKRDVLRKRVEKRINEQLSRGFEKEVKSLLKYSDKLKNILGYREMIMHLKGDITISEYKERLINKTMNLAKRQKTWCKNKMEIEVFNAESNTLLDDVLKRIEVFIGE